MEFDAVVAQPFRDFECILRAAENSVAARDDDVVAAPDFSQKPTACFALLKRHSAGDARVREVVSRRWQPMRVTVARDSGFLVGKRMSLSCLLIRGHAAVPECSRRLRRLRLFSSCHCVILLYLSNTDMSRSIAL